MHTTRKRFAGVDLYALYEAAVQNVEADLDFVERVFRKEHGVSPRRLKEDFCGTALLATEWAKRGPQRRSIGVDLDAEALAWARRHNLGPAGPSVAGRVELVHADVLAPSDLRADVVCALNFSYFLLPTRQQLLAYDSLPGGRPPSGGRPLSGGHGRPSDPPSVRPPARARSCRASRGR